MANEAISGLHVHDFMGSLWSCCSKQDVLPDPGEAGCVPALLVTPESEDKVCGIGENARQVCSQ